MRQFHSTKTKRKGTHFTWEERLVLDRLLNGKASSRIRSPQKLAEILGKSKRTIQREVKRGWTTKVDTYLREFKAYNPDLSQLKADENLLAKGPDLKLGCDFELVNKIADLIINYHYSPDAIIMHFNKQGWPSETRISIRTLYRYIDDDLIPNVTTDNLLRKRKRKKCRVKGPRRHARAASARKSISLRPDEIKSRQVEGHWEMDCVVSGRGKGTSALLTLTERSKRYQIIRKIKDQSSYSVVAELDKIERNRGSRSFRKIFKTITCDNGSEFMDTEGMERSALTLIPRTDIYYAHPYCASERGSNENANGIIRRFIPKGSAIKDYSKESILEIQDWMNNYPRRILNGLSANETFQSILQT